MIEVCLQVSPRVFNCRNPCVVDFRTKAGVKVPFRSRVYLKKFVFSLYEKSYSDLC